jgi:RNA polymerase sigma-70 factor (ECF subfamily)
VETEPSTGATPPDADLVRATLAGRREAFGQLVERYQRRATSVAYRLLGDLHDALEVCQESFVRAFRKLDSLKDHDRFGPWLLRIVTNLALNFRRSRGPRLSFTDCLTDADDSREERVSDSPQSEDRPGALLAGEELRERIQAAMAQLTPQQRAALVLFSIEQLPQKDVARIMNCSVEAVKWHVFQGRKKMKELLADYL